MTGRKSNLYKITCDAVEKSYLHFKLTTENNENLILEFFSVKYSSSIFPACLHVGNDVKDDKAVATGFGLTSVDVNSKSEELLKVFFNWHLIDFFFLISKYDYIKIGHSEQIHKRRMFC